MFSSTSIRLNHVIKSNHLIFRTKQMIGLASATRSTSSGQIGQRESTTGNPSWSSDQQIPPNSTQQEKAKKTVDFGFQQVSPEEKSEKVQGVFSSVASKYDLMNDVMSAGIHRCWKQRFIQKLDPIPGTHLLDVAGGTGDISFKFIDHLLQKQPTLGRANCEVTVCDFSSEMLRIGRQRSQQLNYESKATIRWIEGDAQRLPFDDNQFDAYTIAFGIRNVVDIDQALREAYRVLKPGGIFMCLEFSKLRNPLLEGPYDWYSFNIIPVMGELLAGDWKSYRYLVESIRKFPDQQHFQEMIEKAGFSFVDYENLTQGVAAIHTGYKNL